MAETTPSYASGYGNWLKYGYATAVSASISYYVEKGGWIITSVYTGFTAWKA
jgi:hypothetical protein